MSFDQNAWYTLTSPADNHTRSMQWCSEHIACFSDQNITGTNASWQFVSWTAPASTTASTTINWTIRNRGIGPSSALAISQGPNITWAGFAAREDNDDTQQWNVVLVGQASGQDLWFIKNIQQGVDYNLAETNSTLFMVPAATSLSIYTQTQTWMATKVGEINDAAWSPTPVSCTPTTNNGQTVLPRRKRVPIANLHYCQSAASNPNPMTNSLGAHKLTAGQIGATVACSILAALLLFVILPIFVIMLIPHRRRRLIESHATIFAFIGSRAAKDILSDKGSDDSAVELPLERSSDRAELPAQQFDKRPQYGPSRTNQSRSS